MSQAEREARIQAVAERLLVGTYSRPGPLGTEEGMRDSAFQRAAAFVAECERRMAAAEEADAFTVQRQIEEVGDAVRREMQAKTVYPCHGCGKPIDLPIGLCHKCYSTAPSEQLEKWFEEMSARFASAKRGPGDEGERYQEARVFGDRPIHVPDPPPLKRPHYLEKVQRPTSGWLTHPERMSEAFLAAMPAFSTIDEIEEFMQQWLVDGKKLYRDGSV